MSRGAPHLVLHPERCDRCGACLDVCDEGAIRVGADYVFVDRARCTLCGECARVCPADAIEQIQRVELGATAPASQSAAQVVVGSRAEAKALRARAGKEAKAASRVERREAAEGRTQQSIEALEAEGQVVWTLSDAAIVLGVMLLALVAKDVVLASDWIGLLPPDGRVLARTLALAIFYALQLATMSVLASRKGMTLAHAFGLTGVSHPPRARLVSAGIVLGLFVATRVATTLYGAAVDAAGWEPPARVEVEFADRFGAGTAGLVLASVMVVIVGPFVEELVFRGVLLRALSRFGALVAVIGSAGLFALYHREPWLFVPMLALGTALGWLAWSRRSLWAAIALHSLYNAAAVAAAFYTRA